MLKMGQMCHCKRTLWKLDPASGAVQWSVDRGADSAGLAYRLSGSDLHLFESGTDDADHGQVTGWLSASGAAPSREWDYDKSGLAAAGDVEIDVNDSVVWVVTGSTLSRLNYSDGTLVNESGAIVPTGPLLYKAPTTSMNVHGTGSTVHRQYNSTFTLVAGRTLTTGSALMCKPKGSAPQTDGFVTHEGSGGFGGYQVRNLDSALSVLTTWSSAVLKNIYASSITKMLVHYSAALRLVTISGFSEDWNQVSSAPVSAVLDSSHNAYCVEGTTTVRRRAAADGASEWTNTDLSSISALHLVLDASNLYVIGGMVYDGQRVQVAAINLSTGATEWTFSPSSESTPRMRHVRIVDSSVYVCGDRM